MCPACVPGGMRCCKGVPQVTSPWLPARRAEGGLDLMRAVLGEHLKGTGRALITDPERTKDPVDFVHRLLHEKDKYDRCGCAEQTPETMLLTKSCIDYPLAAEHSALLRAQSQTGADGWQRSCLFERD